MLWQSGAFGDAPARRRAGDGLRRPRAREGHHDPRQEHRGPLRRPGRRRRADDDQHHRHPWPRRLRRRGRARAVDGRRDRAAGRRVRGPAAADPLRAAQGARSQAAGRPRGQQGRPSRRADRRGRRRDVRAVPRPARRRRTTRTRSTSRSSTRRRKAGRASLEQPADGAMPDSPDLEPLFRTILETVPAPTYVEGAPLQAHVTNLDASPFLGRLALCRVHEGTSAEGPDGRLVPARRLAAERSRSPSCWSPRRSSGCPASRPARATSSRSPGSPRSPSARRWPTPTTRVALPLITVDEPAISMTIGINTSPLAGRGKGTKVTARLVKDRLDRELVGNVSIRVLPTERPDAWEVQGRGELALAILVEQMRREGYELTVGKPQVVTREIDGKVHEPVERLTIDAPEEYLGAITQLLAVRKGRMEQMINHGTGWVRMEFLVPARGPDRLPHRVPHRHPRHRHRPPRLRGLRAVVRRAADPAERLAGRRPRRRRHVVRDDQPAGARHAVRRADHRGLRGHDRRRELARRRHGRQHHQGEEDDQRPRRTRTSSRSWCRRASCRLEQSLEFCREDECVEVTPDVVRIRKVVLDQTQRARTAAKARRT